MNHHNHATEPERHKMSAKREDVLHLVEMLNANPRARGARTV
jgi:hypothetical protein